jgi:hypothetical protein
MAGNSGNEFATQFSNENSSNKSSLGFYTTGELYNGKHGLSLKLDGQERGINCNARARAIVMHAADYVSESFAKQHSRIGRSLGCPALPNHLNKEIVNLIKGKSCLFIYHPSRSYTPGHLNCLLNYKSGYVEESIPLFYATGWIFCL